MYVTLKLGLTRLTCVYNVHLVKNTKKFTMNEPSKKENLDQLDRKIEEFKSRKNKDRPKQLSVQTDKHP